MRCGCVWLGSGSGCAPPLLAGVSGFVSACVRAPLAARHSWLGCAAWPCVLRLGSRLRPASPGLGVWVCVCLCACSACTPPLPARACGVGVCAWARISAAPRHSWLGCWAVCVLLCALRLHPATPGTGARCGCVCLDSGFGCAPPLVAGVLGCVCACVGALLAPRHSWLGCAPWVCVFGLGFRLCPATPGWGVGVCVCSCACPPCTPPLLVGVCGVGVCVWARVSAAPRHYWLGCWGVCVLVCVLLLYLASPGWGARCGCVCLGSGFGCAPPLLAGVLGCVCARVRTPLAPSHSWHGCAVWVCVFGLGFPLRLATPGWGVGLCVCWCGRSACTPPLVARVRAVGVCVWARVSAAPRHSWLGCWGVCVLVCVPPLYPATPGWGVRCGCVFLGSGLSCTPPLLAWVLGCVCAGVRAPPVPRLSWLGCAACVCVLGLGFWLRPATPGWAVGLCVCSCARSACTLPLLAGVRDVGVCVWARVLAAPRHSWLGCWAVCVLVCALRLHPATPGWGARSGCVCLGSGFACAPPLLAGVLGSVCLVCALRLHPAPPGTGARCGCVCLGSGFGCAPPLLAGVLGCVCAGVGALLAPRHCWPGCAPWVCVFGLGSRLRPATPCWGVGLCVCSSACPPHSPPLLAGVCGVGVCVWARVSAAPRHSWLGCWGVCVLVLALCLHPASPGWGARRGRVCFGSGFGCAQPRLAGVLGCVCAPVRAPLVPRHSWLESVVWVCVSGLGFRLLVVPCPLVPPVALGPCALRRSVLRCSPALCVFCRCVVVCAVVRRSALCCVCPGVLCCAFPVPSALCGAVLRCAGALALCCLCGACCCWHPVLWCAAVCCGFCFGVLWCGAGSGGPWLSAGAVLLRPAVRFPLLVVLGCVFSLCVRCCVALHVVLFGSGCVCAVVGAPCCGVSLCVVVSPWAFCGVVVPLWCVVVSCCAVRCPVVSCALCCVLRCLAVLCWWAVLCGCLRCWCLFFLLSSFPLLNIPAVFPCL